MSYYLYVIFGIQGKGIYNSCCNYYLQEPQENGRLFFTVQTTVEIGLMMKLSLYWTSCLVNDKYLYKSSLAYLCLSKSSKYLLRGANSQ